MPADDGESLGFEALGQCLGLLVARELDPDLPLGGPALRRFGGFALLEPLVLLGDLLGRIRKGNGAILPGLLDGVPAFQRGHRRLALVLDPGADGA